MQQRNGMVGTFKFIDCFPLVGLHVFRLLV